MQVDPSSNTGGVKHLVQFRLRMRGKTRTVLQRSTSTKAYTRICVLPNTFSLLCEHVRTDRGPPTYTLPYV